MRRNKYSNLKIFRHPEKIQSFTDNNISAPLYVRVKPINLCDHGCFFCAYSTGFRVKDNEAHDRILSGMHLDMRERDKIPPQKMFEILEDFHDMGIRAITWSGGGEPLLHDRICEFLDASRAAGISNSIITNGSLLSGRRAEALASAAWVRVSVDYFSDDSMIDYRNVKPGSYQKILENLASFATIKADDCDLGVNFIVHPGNHLYLEDAANDLVHHGVKNIRFSPVYSEDFDSVHEPICDVVNAQIEKIRSRHSRGGVEIYSSYPPSIDKELIRHSRERSYSKCYYQQIVPVIGADQNVYTCHNKAYDSEGVIGSIRERSFKDLWFSEETKRFFDNFDAHSTCRHECAADKKNLLLNEFLNLESDDFI